MTRSRPLNLVITAAALLTTAAAFTITMSHKDDGPSEEEEEGLRPNFGGHWWILIKDHSSYTHRNSSVPDVSVEAEEEDEVEALSVMWYLGAFGGLIAFFLVVTCSEWCCGKHLYGAGTERASCPEAPPGPAKPQTPPPPYHLFAPPPYPAQDKPEPPPPPHQPPASVYLIPVPS